MIDLFGRLKNIISKTDYLQDMEDGVYFDSVTGGVGTDWPIGTAQSPSNVIASVITMCTARKTKKIYVNGALTLGATMEGYTFVGVNQSATITLGGQDVDTSHFYNCTITGTQAGTGTAYAHNCMINAVVDFCMDTDNCEFVASAATVVPRASSTQYWTNVDGKALLAASYSVIDFTDHNSAVIVISGATGVWQITNMDGVDDAVMFSGKGAELIDNANCGAGNIIVYGDVLFTKGSGGATEINSTIYANIAAVNALVAVTKAGKSNMAVTTVDLHNAAGDRLIATCATQAVIIDSIVFSPHDDLSDDAGFTGISIQDDDTTPHIFVSSTDGVKANLTAYAQLAWTGAIKLRVGKKINCTIIGGTATADPSTCDVEITYHAVVDGGTL